MKRNAQGAAAAAVNNDLPPPARDNGASTAVAEPMSADLSLILDTLRRMRDGDFSVRLPGSWIGLPGKIADTFNDIVAANQQMAEELKRVGQVVGKEGRTRERTRFLEPRGRWGDTEVSLNSLVEDWLAPTPEVTAAIPPVPEATLLQPFP